MRLCVSPLLRHAEEILDTAVFGSQEAAIVIGRGGAVRIVEPAGWSLPGLLAEYGAVSVYKVHRRGPIVCVEGWDGTRACRLEKPALHDPLQRGNFAGRGQNLLGQLVSAGLTGSVAGELERDHLAVFRHPYAADPAEYLGIVGSLDGNPHFVIA